VRAEKSANRSTVHSGVYSALFLDFAPHSVFRFFAYLEMPSDSFPCAGTKPVARRSAKCQHARAIVNYRDHTDFELRGKLWHQLSSRFKFEKRTERVFGRGTWIFIAGILASPWVCAHTLIIAGLLLLFRTRLCKARFGGIGPIADVKPDGDLAPREAFRFEIADLLASE